MAVENIDLTELSKPVGTPFYCYSLNSLEENFRKVDESYKNNNLLICYSIKANSNQSIIKTFSNLGCGADVVSLGELKTAIKENNPGNKILFSVVGKNKNEIKYAL
ncbi:MAG: diaminopimelate decarboxylase, partial [Pseudomonadota bacterium]|nr:diaminopimelate decarboxylase [Pseudomonadota bacterium]